MEVDRIADDSRDDHQQYHQMDIKIVGGQAESAPATNRQGNLPAETASPPARFRRTESKQNGINPDAVLGDQLGRCTSIWQDEITKKLRSKSMFVFTLYDPISPPETAGAHYSTGKS